MVQAFLYDSQAYLVLLFHIRQLFEYILPQSTQETRDCGWLGSKRGPGPHVNDSERVGLCEDPALGALRHSQ